MIAGAMVDQPKKVATRLGTFGELLYAVAPKTSDKILNTAYGLFPESQAAKGKGGGEAPDKAPTHRGPRLRAPDERRSLVGRGHPSAGHARFARFECPAEGTRALRERPPMRARASAAADGRAAEEALGVGVRGSGAFSEGAGGGCGGDPGAAWVRG